MSEVKTLKALRITPDGDGEVITVKTALGPMKDAIGGGHIECVTIAGVAYLYVDEEGKLKGLPVNLPASALAHGLGWPPGDMLCGPVVFFGIARDGNEADVPVDVLRAWESGSGASSRVIGEER